MSQHRLNWAFTRQVPHSRKSTKQPPERSLSMKNKEVIQQLIPGILETGKPCEPILFIYEKESRTWDANPFTLYFAVMNNHINHGESITDLDVSDEVKTLRNELILKAQRTHKYLHPYTGSQFVLFKNGVLDTYNEKLLSPNDQSLASIQFTSNQLIDINYTADKLHSTEVSRTLLSFLPEMSFDEQQLWWFSLALSFFSNHDSGLVINFIHSNEHLMNPIFQIMENLYHSATLAVNFDEQITSCIATSHLTMINAAINQKIMTQNQISKYLKASNWNSKPHTALQNEFRSQLYVNSVKPITIQFKASKTLSIKLPTVPQLDLTTLTDDNLCQDSLLELFVFNMVQAFFDFVPQSQRKNFNFKLLS